MCGKDWRVSAWVGSAYHADGLCFLGPGGRFEPG
jgi:hypothetical protein